MKQFFQCSDCAKHFTEMATTPEALAVSSHREAVLWMWRAHNQVHIFVAISLPQAAQASAARSQQPLEAVCITGLLAAIHSNTSLPDHVGFRVYDGEVKAHDSHVLLCALPGAAVCGACGCQDVCPGWHQTLCFLV